MLTLYVIFAVLAAGILALSPRSAPAAVALLAIAGLEVALGASVASALRVVVPIVVFLTAALTLAASLDRAGLADRAAHLLAAASRGRGALLYALACLLTALLTAVVSLDGAVVLMIPVAHAVARVTRAPFGPLFLGIVTVANAASIAVPQGNPTNLVLMDQLGLSPTAFLTHMVGPGIAAAALCAAVVGVRERRSLVAATYAPVPTRTPFSRGERSAGLALAAAALTGWLAPLASLAPWWPFAAVVSLTFLLRRERPPLIVPWRLGAQIVGLLVTIQALGVHLSVPPTLGLTGLIVVALSLGAAAAVANNLPVTASAATLLTIGSAAYAASIGLAVGALATPQGSVATLIASDLAGSEAPTLSTRLLFPLACVSTLIASVALWATL